MKKQYMVWGLRVIIVGVGGFFGGRKYENSTLVSQGLLRGAGINGNVAGGPMGAGRGGNRSGGPAALGANGGDVTSGDVTAKDATSITLKMRDGSSKIVFVSGSTTVGKSDPGTLSDISVGQTVMVNGKSNADGSLNAQGIQIRPAQPSGQPQPQSQR